MLSVNTEKIYLLLSSGGIAVSFTMQLHAAGFDFWILNFECPVMI